jgi:LysR family glycine cleavage system transcriptional activator
VLARATEQLPGRKATGMLSISSAPTFASKIVLPRLDRFVALHPDIRVTIDTSHRLVDLALDDFDVAIRFMSIKQPAADWTLLAAETLVPVCSPSLQQQFGAPLDVSLLSRAPLIHLTVVSADWHYWFRSSGAAMPPSIDGGLRVDSMQMAFDAAVRGFGIVLGRRPLVDDELASGSRWSTKRSRATAAIGW